MKLLKLLTLPAVLVLGMVLSVPAFAHSLGQATITVGCGAGDNAGKICVHLSGEVESGNDERFVFLDVFAANDTRHSLGQISFDVPANHGDSPVAFDQTECFPTFTSTATSFVVRIVKVTSDSAGKNPSDLSIDLNGQTISFTSGHQYPVTVGTAGVCTPASPTPTPSMSPSPGMSPSPSPSSTPNGGGGAGSPSPSASPVATLAQTGGFDFRFPLIGLLLLAAGGALFFISASRGRSASTK